MAKEPQKVAPIDEEILSRKPRSPWRDAWRQLLKNKMAVAGGVFIIILFIVAIFTDNSIYAWILGEKVKPLLAPYYFAKGNLRANYAPPSIHGPYLLGADFMGRDILSRTMYGARVSLSVAIVAATVSLLIGISYGVISGYSSSRVDNFMMRFVDFLYGFPIIIFVILLQSYFKAAARHHGEVGMVGILFKLNSAMGGLLFVFIAIGLLNWIGMARIARGQVLSVKEKDFIEAARAIGAGNGRIIFRHVLPNILGPCIVAESLNIPGYVFLEAFLSFIGLGVDAPTPSWGIMIQEGYQAIASYPHVIFPPTAALFLTTLAFNFLGDGLRDALDPRLYE